MAIPIPDRTTLTDVEEAWLATQMSRHLQELGVHVTKETMTREHERIRGLLRAAGKDDADYTPPDPYKIRNEPPPAPPKDFSAPDPYKAGLEQMRKEKP